MSGNRSLDEFLSGDGEEPQAGVDGGERETGSGSVAGEADGGRPGEDGARDDPAIATTYGWSPDGVACPACGAVVEERWSDGGALVCADCKDW